METPIKNSSSADADHVTYQRLNAEQIRIVADRINSDRRIRLAQLAGDMGISRAMLHNILTGAHRTRADRLLVLVERLSLDPQTFFV